MGKNKSKKKPRTEFQKMRSLNAKLDKLLEKTKKGFVMPDNENGTNEETSE